jgi:hypothetical protein
MQIDRCIHCGADRVNHYADGKCQHGGRTYEQPQPEGRADFEGPAYSDR